MERVRIELRALIRPAKDKSRRLFYWREHTAYMFMNIRVYTVMYICSCECVWLPRKVCNLSVQWLDIKQMSAAADLGIRALVSCLPGVIPALTRAPQVLSHGCVVWHFVCLVLLLCFLPCLGWPRLKTIRYHDLTFSQKTSPLLFFAFFGFYSIDIIFAFFILCYIKCCKFVLILQSKLPCPLLDILRLATKLMLYNPSNFSH